MSPSAYFKAADVVKDHIILIAYAHSGFQAAVVINRHEWDTKKQVMIQMFQPGDACLIVEPFRYARADAISWTQECFKIVVKQLAEENRATELRHSQTTCYSWPNGGHQRDYKALGSDMS
ncbi:TPA: hypothetical protein ACH3X1_013599 [Trebouxia sp. C0004]